MDTVGTFRRLAAPGIAATVVCVACGAIWLGPRCVNTECQSAAKDVTGNRGIPVLITGVTTTSGAGTAVVSTGDWSTIVAGSVRG